MCLVYFWVSHREIIKHICTWSPSVACAPFHTHAIAAVPPLVTAWRMNTACSPDWLSPQTTPPKQTPHVLNLVFLQTLLPPNLVFLQSCHPTCSKLELNLDPWTWSYLQSYFSKVWGWRAKEIFSKDIFWEKQTNYNLIALKRIS